MRFSSRVRTRSQRGYVLISAIVLAILFFALMTLMLIDSSRALREAQRVRSRIIASTLAENAAELAAVDMINRSSAQIDAEDWQGKMTSTMQRASDVKLGIPVVAFNIAARGITSGVQPVTSEVRVQGVIESDHIRVDFTYHSQ